MDARNLSTYVAKTYNFISLHTVYVGYGITYICVYNMRTLVHQLAQRVFLHTRPAS